MDVIARLPLVYAIDEVLLQYNISYASYKNIRHTFEFQHVTELRTTIALFLCFIVLFTLTTKHLLHFYALLILLALKSLIIFIFFSINNYDVAVAKSLEEWTERIPSLGLIFYLTTIVFIFIFPNALLLLFVLFIILLSFARFVLLSMFSLQQWIGITWILIEGILLFPTVFPLLKCFSSVDDKDIFFVLVPCFMIKLGLSPNNYVLIFYVILPNIIYIGENRQRFLNQFTLYLSTYEMKFGYYQIVKVYAVYWLIRFIYFYITSSNNTTDTVDTFFRLLWIISGAVLLKILTAIGTYLYVHREDLWQKRLINSIVLLFVSNEIYRHFFQFLLVIFMDLSHDLIKIFQTRRVLRTELVFFIYAFLSLVFYALHLNILGTTNIINDDFSIFSFAVLFGGIKLGKILAVDLFTDIRWNVTSPNFVSLSAATTSASSVGTNATSSRSLLRNLTALNNDLNVLCVICQDIVTNPYACKTRCNHIFHRLCLVNWVKVRFVCPSCNYEPLIRQRFWEDINL